MVTYENVLCQREKGQYPKPLGFCPDHQIVDRPRGHDTLQLHGTLCNFVVDLLMVCAIIH